MFITSRLVLALGLGAIPTAVLNAMGVMSPWGVIAGWVALCAAGAAADVALSANARQLEVIRRAPAQALRGEPLGLSLVLQNTGTRKLRGRVRDAWPAKAEARFGGSGAEQAKASAWGRLDMSPGERLRVPLTVTPKRTGDLRSDAVVVRAYGPLGLAGRQAHHALPGTVRVIRGPWRSAKAPTALEAVPGDRLEDALQGEDGGQISAAIAELRDLAAVYGSREHLKPAQGSHPVFETIYENFTRAAGRQNASPDHSARILPLTEHITDLFVRVRQSGTDQQLRLLISQYKDTLAKLTKALADDYYGDVLRNPHYWSDPEDRIREVQRAIEAVDLQAVENIRQLNESRDLEFQVALDSLIRTIDEAKLSDVYSDRAASTPSDRENQ